MTMLDAGRVVLDAANDRLLVDGEPVRLRGKPLGVLQALMSRHGQLVTKEDLLESVWEGRPHSDAVLTTAIKEIRQALGDSPRSPWAIETVHRRGYRFLLPVSLSERADPDRSELAAPSERRTAPRVPRLALSVAVLFLLAVVSLLMLSSGEDASVRSVAVLPFDDMTSGGDHRWFADGLGEELLNSLVRIDGLRVSARTSTERFADNPPDVREIGKALGVSHVIEGSVRNAAHGQMRLTVQLIRAHDGFHQWSSTWDRDLTLASALDIQRYVSEQVAALMEGRPRVPASPVATLPDPAWELLVRGRQLVERRTADSIDAGTNLLHEALEMVPEHPATHAALATAYLLAADAMLRPFPEAIATAGRHAARALELDPDSVDALVASAFLAIADRDLEKGLELADAAIAISPGHAGAHHRRGTILTMLGSINEAFDAMAVARRLDPLSPLVLASYSQLALFTGHFDEAFEVARDNLRWNPQNHTARGMMGWLALQAGLYERAVVCLRSGLEAGEASPRIAGHLAEVYWRIGADVLAFSVDDGPAGWPARSAVRLGRGDLEGALADPARPQYSGPNGLTLLDIYYWSEDIDAASAWAVGFLEAVRDPQRLVDVGALPDNAVPALAILEAAGDPRAGGVRDALHFRFLDRSPGDARTLGDLLSGAAWHAREGDEQAAIAWLERAAELGFVMREVDLDPAFGSIRSLPEFLRLRSRMEQRAAEVRADLGTTDAC